MRNLTWTLLAVAAWALPGAGRGEAQESIVDLYRAAAVGHFVGAMQDEPQSVRVEPAIWPNGALGLERPGELSTQALVEGHRITITGKKQAKTLEYRAGKGQVRVRLSPERVDLIGIHVPQKGEAQPVDLYRAAASGHFTATTGEAALQAEVTAMEWPDGALGLARAGEGAADVLVPGFKLTLRGKTPAKPAVEYRAGGQQVRVRLSPQRIDVIPLALAREQKAETDQPTTLVLTRKGGFAGFMDQMTIQVDGAWSGRGKRGARAGKLNQAQRKVVQEFLNGDLWKKHRGEVGFDPQLSDALSLGFEVKAGEKSLGRFVIHDLAKSPAPIYGELSKLIDLLYT
jgi:hypothetical protein